MKSHIEDHRIFIGYIKYVPIQIGSVYNKIHIFIINHTERPLLLRSPWHAAAKHKSEIDKQGILYTIRSDNNNKIIRFRAATLPDSKNQLKNRIFHQDKPSYQEFTTPSLN